MATSGIMIRRALSRCKQGKSLLPCNSKYSAVQEIRGLRSSPFPSLGCFPRHRLSCVFQCQIYENSTPHTAKGKGNQPATAGPAPAFTEAWPARWLIDFVKAVNNQRHLPGTVTCGDMLPQSRSDESHYDGKSARTWNWRRIRLPSFAIAFSIFSKEKKELDEAHQKLKNVDALEMLLKRAKLSEMKRDWQDADKFYHEALALLNSRQQDKSWDDKQVTQAQVYIYDNMANLALSRGRLNESEILYKETMKGLISSGRSKDDNAIMEISMKLAMIYAMQQRDSDAEAGYKFCMESLEKKFQNVAEVDDETLALLGMCINSYSRFLIIHGRVKEADSALKKTVGIAVKALTEDHPQVAVLYSDLATTATMLKDLDAAKSYIDKALAIATKSKSSDLATLWCNKGLICFERTEFSEAEAACKKAIKLAKESNDTDMMKEATECLDEIRKERKKAV